MEREDWNGTQALSVGTGPHWSPGEQGRSGDGASPLQGVLVATCGQSLGSQLNLSHASLLRWGHTSQGRIMQYLLDTNGSKPAPPTPTSPLKYFSMAAVRERNGEVASSFPWSHGVRQEETPRLVSHFKPQALVHILLKVQG